MSNQRNDEYGGSFDNRVRFVLRVAKAVRDVWPDPQPLFARISASDWTPGGWDIGQSIELSKSLKQVGVDLIDASSGGNVAAARIPVGPGYQVDFAAAIRREAAIATGAVRMITEPVEADTIIASGQADMVLLARELLRDPYWPRCAAAALGTKVKPPVQYERAW